MLHAPDGEFTASLEVLLEGLVQALEVSFALIRVRSTSDERLPGVSVQFGTLTGFKEGELEAIVEQALAAAVQGQPISAPPDSLPVWLSLPLVMPESATPEGRTTGGRGILFIGVNHPYTIHPRQQVIIQAVAAQAALLVENEHLIRSLEYKIVIQERARLAREIHDGLAQSLGLLKLQIAQMQKYMEHGEAERLQQILSSSYETAANAYQDARYAIDGLRISPGGESLTVWLNQIVADFQDHVAAEQIRVHLSLEDIPIEPPPEVEVQLIRILQEAFNNIRKHARASQVWVSCQVINGDFILEVRDNGIGFSPEDVIGPSHHGLKSMRERAELIGADFQVISLSKQGTVIRVSLPVKTHEVTL
jgi:two-component system nitrate/nitrite sensor histidine kinase NarX